MMAEYGSDHVFKCAKPGGDQQAAKPGERWTCESCHLLCHRDENRCPRCGFFRPASPSPSTEASGGEWRTVIVPSELDADEQWQRNSEYVSLHEAEEKLEALSTRLAQTQRELNRALEASSIAETNRLNAESRASQLEAELGAKEGALRAMTTLYNDASQYEAKAQLADEARQRHRELGYTYVGGEREYPWEWDARYDALQRPEGEDRDA